jgi:thiosulfate/3-mercaptopyruvate sulfurtransferase
MRAPMLTAVLATIIAADSAHAQRPAPPANPLVSAEWLVQHLHDPGLVVLHVEGRRTSYDAGHVPGAQFISPADFTVDGENDVGYELPPVPRIVEALQKVGVGSDSRVIIVGGDPLAATRLWLTLDYVGMGDRTSILDGGFAAWKATSGPLVTGATPAKPGTLTARPRADMIVDAEWIRARLEDPETVLVDARPENEYTGEDGGMGGMAHPGHIPGAYNMYWEELVESRQHPFFLAAGALRQKFSAAGAEDADRVVAYCMIGARASLTYFAGRMLGYDMKFYDGSWHDWGTRDLPYVGGRSRR